MGTGMLGDVSQALLHDAIDAQCRFLGHGFRYGLRVEFDVQILPVGDGHAERSDGSFKAEIFENSRVQFAGDRMDILGQADELVFDVFDLLRYLRRQLSGLLHAQRFSTASMMLHFYANGVSVFI